MWSALARAYALSPLTPLPRKRKAQCYISLQYIFEKEKFFVSFFFPVERGSENFPLSLPFNLIEKTSLSPSAPGLSTRTMLGLGYGDLLIVAVVAAVLVGE